MADNNTYPLTPHLISTPPVPTLNRSGISGIQIIQSDYSPTTEDRNMTLQGTVGEGKVYRISLNDRINSISIKEGGGD